MLNKWLTTTASITDLLKAESGDARLQVLNHTWEDVDAFDVNTLKLEKNSQALHREILMHSHNKPCWYARTIIPQATYLAYNTLFEQLNIKPLGEIIYNNSQITRKIHPYQITPSMLEYQYLTHALENKTLAETYWGRLSSFKLENQLPFYLLEIFLPALLKYCP